MRIGAHTQVIALLGYPVEHSLSPLIHNTALASQGLDFVYVARPVAPDDLAAAVEGLRALRFVGANVTIPHKQRVLPLLDELSEQARAVGAVNTIVARADERDERFRLYGDNTDVAGFQVPLRAYARRLTGMPMVVWGAGGAARAAAYALLSAFAPAALTVAARDVQKAQALVDSLRTFDPGRVLSAARLEEAAPAVRESSLLVNTTPLGMYPHTEGTPWPDAQDFSSRHIVYDLVYNPRETRLLRDAAVRGATTLGGLAMLIGQAAASYVQWTGRDMPTDEVEHALRTESRAAETA